MRAGIANGETEELINAIRLLCPDLGFFKNPGPLNGNSLLVRGKASDIRDLKKVLMVLKSDIEISIDGCETQAVMSAKIKTR